MQSPYLCATESKLHKFDRTTLKNRNSMQTFNLCTPEVSLSIADS